MATATLPILALLFWLFAFLLSSLVNSRGPLLAALSRRAPAA